MTQEQAIHEALVERHRRLKTIADDVVVRARAASDPDQALVPTHLVRALQRELDGTPQPSALVTMSVS